jgi:putative oxidoreductase
MNNSLEQYYDVAILFLRIGVGIIFIVAGWGKLTGIEGTQGFFDNVGIPAPALMAWVVALIEFVGGLMVLLGLYIRVPSLLLAFVMIGALIFVKLGGEWNPMRIDISLLSMTLALFILGSGRISFEHLFKN